MATGGPPRQPSVALDTNVLMDLARREEHTLDAIELIRRRLPGPAFLVLPTVIQELTFISRQGDTVREQGDARDDIPLGFFAALRMTGFVSLKGLNTP